MSLTLDIKKPTRCYRCNKENCQTIWILTNDNKKEEIITRDCEPRTYNDLPEYFHINYKIIGNANEN